MSALSPFARHLVRKGERAIRSARLGLQDGDSDGAVNRAYQAMFNVARAALLSAGVASTPKPSGQLAIWRPEDGRRKQRKGA